MMPFALIVAGIALLVGMTRTNAQGNVSRGTLPTTPSRNVQRIGNAKVETPRFTPVSAPDAPDAAAPTIDDLYRKHARATGIEWLLLKAVAIVESGQNPNAVNLADPSFGIMQVLCSGTSGPQDTCTNRLPAVEDWPPTRETLMDPDFNIYFGSQILAWNVNRFGLPKGIAVYNSWGARTAADSGPFPNQGYVDKVRAAYVTVGGKDPRILGTPRRLVAV